MGIFSEDGVMVLTKEERNNVRSEYPGWQVSLGETQLKTLGTITAVWGQVDFLLVQIIAVLLETTAEKIIALNKNATSGRLQQLVSANAYRVPQFSEQLKDLCFLLEDITQQRNHIVHGAWGWHLSPDGEVLTPACARFKQDEPFRADDLGGLLGRVNAASQITAGLLLNMMQPQRPPLKVIDVPFLFGNSQASGQEYWRSKSPLQPGVVHQRRG